MGDSPDLMTHARMSALVAPIDSSLLAPFYADVNINNSKFKWYRTGQPGKKSESYYAVPISFVCFAFVSLAIAQSHHITICLVQRTFANYLVPGREDRREHLLPEHASATPWKVVVCFLCCVSLLSSLVTKLAYWFSLCTTSSPKYLKKQEQRIRTTSTPTTIQLMAVFALMRIGSR